MCGAVLIPANLLGVASALVDVLVDHVHVVAQSYDSLVPPVGFEPTRLSAMVFETIMYASSITGAALSAW
jgi:hypothetical protein